ncbi:MAG TPA: type III pantothenate kinase [Chthoniobacterales bacterium]|nr:type III pantothenate kinase [Chthoniobacterales bacterium]
MSRALSYRTTDYLLIDISNSFTKIAFSTQNRVGRALRIPTKKLSRQTVTALLRRRRSPQIVACSVVPAKNAIIRQAAADQPALFLTPKLDLGVGIDYPQPRTIGADRLANAAAVAELYGCPAIVVDFGTAVTFDVVSASREYIGGVISPGLESMTKFLYQRTALLPRLSLREPETAVGKSTRAAMMAGAIFGYRGLVREILARITAEAFPRGQVRIVATGGYAKLVAARLPEIEAVHADLTLEGLRIIANRNVTRRLA